MSTPVVWHDQHAVRYLIGSAEVNHQDGTLTITLEPLARFAIQSQVKGLTIVQDAPTLPRGTRVIMPSSTNQRTIWTVEQPPKPGSHMVRLRSPKGAKRYVSTREVETWERPPAEFIHANRDNQHGVVCGVPIPATGEGIMVTDAWSRATCPECIKLITAALDATEPKP